MTRSPEDPLITGSVTLQLTNAEALVLFGFLTRAQEEQPERYIVEHQAEARVLWDLLAMLERRLVEPINNPDYADLLEVARTQVKDDNA